LENFLKLFGQSFWNWWTNQWIPFFQRHFFAWKKKTWISPNYYNFTWNFKSAKGDIWASEKIFRQIFVRLL